MALDREQPIFVAGHRGLVGAAITRRLRAEGFRQVVTRGREELDLCNQDAVDRFFAQARPAAVVLAAARVGGIHANNSYPAEFLAQNLQIQTNVIDAAYRYGTDKLLFLGSSCAYPKECPQPIKEEYLLSGHLEPTNKAYAIAKVAGLTMCESYNRQYGTNFIGVMPTNLYGPGDNFDPMTSHALPGMITKFHAAKTRGSATVELWGTGSPRREFLFAADLADASLVLLDHFDAASDEPAFVNAGAGSDLAIRELAETVAEIVQYTGKIIWNTSMPDGAPRKLLDVTRLRAMGWHPCTSLADGIRVTYQAFREPDRTNRSGAYGTVDSLEQSQGGQ